MLFLFPEKKALKVYRLYNTGNMYQCVTTKRQPCRVQRVRKTERRTENQIQTAGAENLQLEAFVEYWRPVVTL